MTKTILLVDDDMDVIEPTQYLLMQEGYNVITASNGEEAVTAYFDNKPDVTFMDIKMPVLNGYEAFKRIINRDSNAKIVFTSGYAIDSEQFQEAKKLGLCGLLPKPVELNSMIKIIEKSTNEIKP